MFINWKENSQQCPLSVRNGETNAFVWSWVSETKAHRISLSFHARSFPYVPPALLPIHHISLWARQLSGAEAYSQFSSPSNCTKYSNSSVKLGQGAEGRKAKSVKEAEPCWWTLLTSTLWTSFKMGSWTVLTHFSSYKTSLSSLPTMDCQPQRSKKKKKKINTLMLL